MSFSLVLEELEDVAIVVDAVVVDALLLSLKTAGVIKIVPNKPTAATAIEIISLFNIRFLFSEVPNCNQLHQQGLLALRLQQ